MLTGWFKISMDHGKGMNVFQASQHLIQEGLDMLSREVLRRHDKLVKVGVNIWSKDKTSKNVFIQMLTTQSQQPCTTFFLLQLTFKH